EKRDAQAHDRPAWPEVAEPRGRPDPDEKDHERRGDADLDGKRDRQLPLLDLIAMVEDGDNTAMHGDDEPEREQDPLRPELAGTGGSPHDDDDGSNTGGGGSDHLQAAGPACGGPARGAGGRGARA